MAEKLWSTEQFALRQKESRDTDQGIVPVGGLTGLLPPIRSNLLKFSETSKITPIGLKMTNDQYN